MNNNNKKIKEAEELYKMLFLDFKDELGYKADIKELKKMSAVQKWFIYDNYAKPDADVMIKRNRLIAEVLGWDTEWLDAIFPVRQVIRTLLKTIGQEIDVDSIIDAKKNIYDIIDGKALTKKLHDVGEDHVRSWHRFFKEQLEKLCQNVHTIGNYMPCPDNAYNRIKGCNTKEHYNDRIDILYSDIIEPWCKKANGDLLISEKQRKEWKAWFDENKERLFLTVILDERIRNELGKFGLIKQDTFSGDELRFLPDYLKTANELIEHRSQKIRAVCTKAVCGILTECYKNILSEFERGKVFLQISDDSKGYAWVNPECEKKFDNCKLRELFYYKYFNEEPIDKLIGEASWNDLFEYAYLGLYDCYIDGEIPAKDKLHIDCIKERAAYFAFKELGLVKDYRPDYAKVNAAN